MQLFQREVYAIGVEVSLQEGAPPHLEALMCILGHVVLGLGVSTGLQPIAIGAVGVYSVAEGYRSGGDSTQAQPEQSFDVFNGGA